MNKYPRISVLLPAFNAAPYIEEAVASILRQTLTDLELLVLDDGSTDATPQLLNRLAAADPRIRVITRANRGLVVTLNELIAAARAPYLARMDADDIALPTRLERQARFLDQYPGVACVGGAIEFINADATPVHTPRPVLDNSTIQREALAGRVAICHPACMLRAGIVRTIGGYREHTWPAEDLDLFLRLGECAELANLPDLVLRYRLHATSISASRAEHQRERIEAVCREAWARRARSTAYPSPQAPTLCEALRIPVIAANPTAAALVAAGNAAS